MNFAWTECLAKVQLIFSPCIRKCSRTPTFLDHYVLNIILKCFSSPISLYFTFLLYFTTMLSALDQIIPTSKVLVLQPFVIQVKMLERYRDIYI